MMGMSDRASAQGKPGAIKTVGGRPVPGTKPTQPAPGKPASIIGGLKSRERPGALPIPATREVSVSRPTAPSEANASPRKPKLWISSRSEPSILEVA